MIQHVRRVPWKEEHLIPVLPFIGSREFHARIPPGLKNYRVHWGDASFTFNTVAPWEGATEGFRTNPPEWPMDIVAVGDSFTFCWTAFEDCWVERLHVDFGWHVMNFGVPGTGSMAHRNVLGVYGPPMEPKIVIWQWYGNDYEDDYDFAGMRGEIEKPLNGPPLRRQPPDYGKLAEYSTVYRWLRDWIDKKRSTRRKTPKTLRQWSMAGRFLSRIRCIRTISNTSPCSTAGTKRIRAFEESQTIVQDMGAEHGDHPLPDQRGNLRQLPSPTIWTRTIWTC